MRIEPAAAPAAPATLAAPTGTGGEAQSDHGHSTLASVPAPSTEGPGDVVRLYNPATAEFTTSLKTDATAFVATLSAPSANDDDFASDVGHTSPMAQTDAPAPLAALSYDDDDDDVGHTSPMAQLLQLLRLLLRHDPAVQAHMHAHHAHAVHGHCMRTMHVHVHCMCAACPLHVHCMSVQCICMCMCMCMHVHVHVHVYVHACTACTRHMTRAVAVPPFTIV